MNNLINRICNEKSTTHCSTTIAHCVRNPHTKLKLTITFQIGKYGFLKVDNFYCEECAPTFLNKRINISSSRKYDPGLTTLKKTHSSLGLNLARHVFSILLINHSPFIPQLTSFALSSLRHSSSVISKKKRGQSRIILSTTTKYPIKILQKIRYHKSLLKKHSKIPTLIPQIFHKILHKFPL